MPVNMATSHGYLQTLYQTYYKHLAATLRDPVVVCVVVVAVVEDWRL